MLQAMKIADFRGVAHSPWRFPCTVYKYLYTSGFHFCFRDPVMISVATLNDQAIVEFLVTLFRYYVDRKRRALFKQETSVDRKRIKCFVDRR